MIKKLLVLTAVLMLTAGTVGCQHCDWFRKGAPAPVCDPCPPCDPCNPCDPCAPGACGTPGCAAPPTMMLPGPGPATIPTQ